MERVKTEFPDLLVQVNSCNGENVEDCQCIQCSALRQEVMLELKEEHELAQDAHNSNSNLEATPHFTDQSLPSLYRLIKNEHHNNQVPNVNGHGYEENCDCPQCNALRREVELELKEEIESNEQSNQKFSVDASNDHQAGPSIRRDISVLSNIDRQRIENEQPEERHDYDEYCICTQCNALRREVELELKEEALENAEIQNQQLTIERRELKNKVPVDTSDKTELSDDQEDEGNDSQIDVQSESSTGEETDLSEWEPSDAVEPDITSSEGEASPSNQHKSTSESETTEVDDEWTDQESRKSKSKKSKPLKCSTCEKRFRCLSLLTRHIRTHTGEKPFKCNWTGCGKRFAQKEHMKNHTRVHTGESSPKKLLKKGNFICTWTGCGKSFSYMHYLTRHRIIHTGEQPYRCDWPDCGAAFNAISTLHKHKRIHTGVKPHACTFAGCKWKFGRRSDMLRHHQRQHSKARTDQRPFACKYEGCNSRFTLSSNLARHIRSKIHRQM